VSAPQPSFAHLARLTDERGTFEHARHTTPRREHGYCTDDMARVLVVTSREPDPDAEVDRLATTALRFVVEAQRRTGNCHNRLDQLGNWRDRPGVGDCWGRSLWGLGTAASRHPDPALRATALEAFTRGALRRSPWPRSMAFAALGAAEVVAAHPGHPHALALLVGTADLLADTTPARGLAVPPVTRTIDDTDDTDEIHEIHDTDEIDEAAEDWPWPEPRLAYANAVLPEAMIAVGTALHRNRLRDDGLDLLGWLLDHETVEGRLSVTPVGGRGPGDDRPAFDQQPIEVAALADACARAAGVTGDDRWLHGVDRAVAWFTGDNDARVVMWDADTGGGYDGLEAGGPNRNQGAESTLALVSTLQQARDTALVAP
jgi:hypothetical protein